MTRSLKDTHQHTAKPYVGKRFYVGVSTPANVCRIMTAREGWLMAIFLTGSRPFIIHINELLTLIEKGTYIEIVAEALSNPSQTIE